MAEYIDKTEIIKAIVAEASHCLVLDKPAEARGYIGAKELIERRKAADVAEVRHGKIIETIKDGKMNRVFSCCGHDFTELTCWYMPKYCPNCGARMDKEDNYVRND